jgi:acyl-homoserine lactone acylase PvdQ
VAPDAPGRDAAELTPDAMADAGTPDTGPGPLDVRITGLTASVSVSFDRYGVTHIRCQTDADCFAAEGYYHAAHRFAQMDLRRRVVRGRLAELFGDITGAVVDQDYSSRLFLATPDGGDLPQALLAAASPATRAMLDAYTRGVNTWLADFRAGRNGARVADEWAAVAGRSGDWEPVDSVAGIIALVASLTNSTSDDIDRGIAASRMTPQEFFDLFGVMPASRAATLDSVDTLRSQVGGQPGAARAVPPAPGPPGSGRERAARRQGPRARALRRHRR